MQIVYDLKNSKDVITFILQIYNSRYFCNNDKNKIDSPNYIFLTKIHQNISSATIKISTQTRFCIIPVIYLTQMDAYHYYIKIYTNSQSQHL
jgi:hypothetical protein